MQVSTNTWVESVVKVVKKCHFVHKTGSRVTFSYSCSTFSPPPFFVTISPRCLGSCFFEQVVYFPHGCSTNYTCTLYMYVYAHYGVKESPVWATCTCVATSGVTGALCVHHLGISLLASNNILAFSWYIHVPALFVDCRCHPLVSGTYLPTQQWA